MGKTIGRIDESQTQAMVELDSKDKMLLSMLSDHSRISLSQIKKTIHLSRDSIDYRMKRLFRKKVLIRVLPIINLKKLGYFTFHTFLLVDEKSKARKQEFLDYLCSLPYVKNIIEYSDIWDFEIVSVARNLWDYDQKFSEITSRFSDILLEKEKLQVIKGYNSINLPNHFQKARLVISKSYRNVVLDMTDIKILDAISDDARLSYFQLGKKLGMTGEGISYRIKNLFDSNVIRRYSAIVNLSALGYHWYTFAMQVKTFDLEWDRKMKSFVEKHPHIIRGVKTLGRWDFLFYIVSQSPTQFHDTAKEIKHRFSDIIRSHDTLLAYKEHHFTSLPRIVIDNFQLSGDDSEFQKDIIE